MRFIKICFLAFIFMWPLAVSGQTADDVIKKYIDFIGGEKKWIKVKTLITAGEYNYGGIKFPFRAYAKAPNLYKFVVPFEGKFYAQAFNGKKGWKIDAFKNETSPTMLTGKPAVLMANEADVELEDVFINYTQKGYRAALEGKDSIDGRPCFKIKFIRQGGEEGTYFFDEVSGVLVVKSAPSKNAELQGAILQTTYSDFRNVDGIKIPFKSISKSGDQTILEITIDKAQINVPIDDNEFEYDH